MSAPPPVNKTVVVVCGTLLVAFVFAGYFYLEVRGRSNMSITTAILQVLTAVPGVLAYIASKRAEVSSGEAAHNTNGAMRTQSLIAARALGELPSDKAAAIVDGVAGTSPADEPPRGSLPRSPGS